MAYLPRAISGVASEQRVTMLPNPIRKKYPRPQQEASMRAFRWSSTFLVCIFVFVSALYVGHARAVPAPPAAPALMPENKKVAPFDPLAENVIDTYVADSTANAGPVPLLRKGKSYKNVESLAERIMSRLKSQEMEEQNWISDVPYVAAEDLSSKFRTAGQGKELGKVPFALKTSRVVTIPMKAVPPRLQSPGSSKGMPAKIRIVEIDRSQISSWDKIFRRKIHRDEKPKKKSRTFSVDLRGGIVGVGEYYSTIELGNKKIRVQVDTGSSTLAVPMTGCKSCIPKANRYSVEDTKFAKTIACDSPLCAVDRCAVSCPVCSLQGACCSADRPRDCGFSLRYADGSAASGSMISDEVKWGELRTNVTFGGILNNSPNFERPEVDGILGMAYKSLACNPSCFDPPFDALVNDGQVDNVFSICMTATGGKLMLGGFTPSVAKTPVKYVPLYLSDPARYYRVRLTGSIKIGDEMVAMPNFKTAIVDTGTTLIVTSTRTFAKLKEHFQKKYCVVPELCGEDSWFQSGMCVSLTDEDMRELPTLTLSLESGVNLELRPEDYMLQYRRGPKTYRCVGIMGMDGLGGMVVLGNTMMQRYVTIYDRINGRVGFAEAAPNCGDGGHRE